MQSIISEDNYCSFSCGSTSSLDCGFLSNLRQLKEKERLSAMLCLHTYLMTPFLQLSCRFFSLSVCLMHVLVLARHHL